MSILSFSSLIKNCKEDLHKFSISNSFTRERKLPLQHILGSLLYKSCSQSEMGYELLVAHYFSRVESNFVKISRSSYSEARDKISWKVFEYLLNKVRLENKSTKWKGHTVQIADGSKILLPRSDDILKEFPMIGNHFGELHYPNARVMVVVDAFTGQAKNVEVGNKHQSERGVVRDFLRYFDKSSITIMDRGFTGKRVWKGFIDQGQYFVVREKASGKGTNIGRMGSSKDVVLDVKVGKEEIKVRFIRGPKFKSGNYLYLSTNLLNKRKYKRKEILELYKKRQVIEDVFLNLKNRCNVTNIRSRKVNGVLQEIYAALVMTSIAGALRYNYEARVEMNKRVSFKAIVWILEQNFVFLIDGKISNVMREQSILFQHTKQINRSYPRFSRQPSNKWNIAKRSA